MIKLTKEQKEELKDYQKILEELGYGRSIAIRLSVKHLFPNEDDATRRKIRIAWKEG